MRREAGAIIIILICFLLKAPDFVRDYRWSMEKSAAGDSTPSIRGRRVPDARPSVSSPDLFPSTSEKRGIEVPPIRDRALTVNGSAEKRLRDIRFRPPKPHLESLDTLSGVPPDFLKDPLTFLSISEPESLLFLPGIGPVIAERIANAASGKRPFSCWEDLLSVKGIGPKKLEILRRIANRR